MNELLFFIGILHDLGKANSFFQQKVRKQSDEKDPIRHELISILMFDFFTKNNISDKVEIEFNKYLINFQNGKINPFSQDDSIKDKMIKLTVLTHHKPLQTIKNFKDIYQELGESLKTSNFINSNKKIKITFNNMKNVFQYFKNKYSQITYIPAEDELMFFKFALISADHFSSSEFKDIYKTSQKNLAKSVIITSENHIPKEYTQSLFKHLARVGINTVKQYHYLKNDRLPIFQNKEYILQDTTSPKFMWQNESINFIQEHKANGFYVVAAKTGAGKTKFCARLINHISRNTRFSVLLGLRNLTLQTYESYKNIFQTSEDLCLNIGSEEVKETFFKEEYEEMKYNTFQETEEIKQFSKNEEFFLKDCKEFILKPILISTIDSIIQGSDFTSYRFMKAFHRIKNSDLILDEVDNYDMNDLYAIGKLIYIAGTFKRNVILSTATANKNIINFFYQMYKHGTRENNEMYLLTDIYNSSGFNALKILEDYSLNIQKNEKHLVEIQDITEFNIKNKVKEMFLNHNEDGLSVGLIRIPHIKNVLKIFYQFLKQDDDIIFFPIMYHSQMFLLYRSYLESILDSSLERKTQKLKDTKLFKILQERYPNKRICALVIATAVEEVGRDHCFDFSIIEPSSTRSIIQTAGRVLRHREKEVQSPNICILNKNFRHQENDKRPVYCYPGYESKKFEIKDNKEMKNIAAYLENGLSQQYVIDPKENETLSIFESNVLLNETARYLDRFMKSNKSFLIYKNLYKEDGLNIIFRESTTQYEELNLVYDDNYQKEFLYRKRNPVNIREIIDIPSEYFILFKDIKEYEKHFQNPEKFKIISIPESKEYQCFSENGFIRYEFGIFKKD